MSVITHAQLLDAMALFDVPLIQHHRLDRCSHRDVPWFKHGARLFDGCGPKGTWNGHGIAVHHTGGVTSWQFVWDGRIGERIPGPLYNGEVYPNGLLHLTGWRITNNVGMINRHARDLVAAQQMPYDQELHPGADDYGRGNLELYGFAYQGTTPNAAQAATMRAVCAAVCHAHGWTAQSIAGHKELTRRKPDPAEDMGRLRRDVRALLT
jgi:hypothetical protein